MINPYYYFDDLPVAVVVVPMQHWDPEVVRLNVHRALDELVASVEHPTLQQVAAAVSSVVGVHYITENE